MLFVVRVGFCVFQNGRMGNPGARGVQLLRGSHNRCKRNPGFVVLLPLVDERIHRLFHQIYRVLALRLVDAFFEPGRCWL